MQEDIVESARGSYTVIPSAELKTLFVKLTASDLADTPVILSYYNALGPANVRQHISQAGL